MSKIKTKPFYLLLLISAFLTSSAETIDGPANVRIKPGKDVIFSLYDNVEVDCTVLRDGWYEVAVNIKITEKQYENQIQIKKGEKLISTDGQMIGVALTDIGSENGYTFSYGGANGTPKFFGLALTGFTDKQNIKPNSLIENALTALLNDSSSNLKFETFITIINQYKFIKDDFLKNYFPNLKEYMLYENSIDDPSPIDRVRLLFENERLIAIIHSRPMTSKKATNYSLVRDLKLLVFKTPVNEPLKTFIQKNIDSYNGVD